MSGQRARLVLLWIAGFTALGLLMFTHYHLDVLAAGYHEPVFRKLVEELTAAYGAALLFPVAILVARRAERRGWSGAGLVALHAVLLLGFSALHTTWNWVTRSALFRLFGHGAYDYGRMPLRYVMELPTDAVFYSLIVGLVYLFGRYRAARERELHVARLEAELDRARLAALEGQLRPHFLFNALNTISSVMYEDLHAADFMLAGLADLLRRTLRRTETVEVSLGDELETVELYVAVMRARFGDRMQIDMLVDEDARQALVPALLLQPLVENALVHGEWASGALARIAVRVRRIGERLVVAVEDNGVGTTSSGSAAGDGHGIGLANTAQRLQHLHGAAATVSLDPLPAGGMCATVTLPFRVAS